MPYDKEAIQRAKEKGFLQNGVFDAKALELDDHEKARLAKELTKVSSPRGVSESSEGSSKEAKVGDGDVGGEKLLPLQLSFWDRIILFFLALLGIQMQESYLQYKAMKQVYRDLSLIRPGIYNRKNRTVTRYFAYRLHDLQMKLLFFKPLFEIMESPLWDSGDQGKTGIERLYEYLMDMDREKIFALFGYESIVSRLRGNLSAQTVATLRQEAEEYLNSFPREKKETVNQAYTFLMYMKNLVFYEFDWLLKRFDPSYAVGQEAQFGDIPAEALLSYFVTLEEALMQIDLQQDFHKPLAALFAIYQEMVGEDEKDEDTITRMKTTFSAQVDALRASLQEFLYRQYLTLLIRVVKKNPSYVPSFVHIRFDLAQKYMEVVGKRLKTTIERAMKQLRFEMVEKNIRAYFPNLTPVGVYSVDRAKELDQLGLPSFSHSYALAILVHFFKHYYQEWMQPVLNTVMMNGVFADEYFRRSVSDAFYAVDKYQTKLQELVNSFEPTGDMGSKFFLLLKKREGTENRRGLEKHIVSMNGMAGDLFREFYTHYVSLKDIVGKLWSDTTEPLPKYVRNAHSVGGAKHSLYKDNLKKSFEFLQSFESILQMLREIPS
ncbi:MAG: DUF5312 domain-containing protein [Brevinematales bacterium]|nr:DUF5312 domain-containing protein [Brevinematales bacterium]